MKNFFANSSWLDHMALRPLSHIRGNWELLWDRGNQKYHEEADSFAGDLNQLIDELTMTVPPRQYHDNEDCLAEYVAKTLNWQIRKVGRRWVGANYEHILEQGGFHDLDERNLVLAAAGRIAAAKRFGQDHFDHMEESHQRMLAAVIAVILYHRAF